jgi:hypothetical protein
MVFAISRGVIVLIVRVPAESREIAANDDRQRTSAGSKSKAQSCDALFASKGMAEPNINTLAVSIHPEIGLDAHRFALLACIANSKLWD